MKNFNKGFIKKLLIVELIVCYLGILTVISHICGPQPYEVDRNNTLLSSQEFIPYGETTVTNGSITLVNSVEGGSTGCGALLSLVGLERIYIEFDIICPLEYDTGSLAIDLYDETSGYDYGDQEYMHAVQEGREHVAFMLETGEYAPEQAQVRFFTTNVSNWEIENLQIYRVYPVPKVSATMIISVVVLLFIFVGTAVCYRMAPQKK